MADAQRWGASPEDWAALSETHGLREDLLPVVSNPNAEVSALSHVKDVGKVPSLYNSAGRVVGFTGWTKHKTTAMEVRRWSVNPDYGICLQTRDVRALDVDVDDLALVDRIEALLTVEFAGGYLPVRRRSDSPRILVFFHMLEDLPYRRLKIDDHNAVEFLTKGKQFIIAGTHPKGARYTVDGGLADIEIPTITAREFEEFWALLVGLVGGESVEVKAAGNRGAIKDEDSDDRVLAALREQGMVKAYLGGGKISVRCPFDGGHSEPDDGTGSSTVYFLPHTNGYANGHFHCLHQSCAGRSDVDYLDALGVSDLPFDQLGDDDPVVVAHNQVQELLDLIELCECAETLKRNIAPRIAADANIDAVDRELLAATIKGRLADLGRPVGIATARELVKHKRKSGGLEIPTWLQGWVYVLGECAFFKVGHGVRRTHQAFMSEFNKHLDDSVPCTDVVRAALDHYDIPRVEYALYMPSLPDRFVHDGFECVNAYCRKRVPRAVAEISAKGQVAVDRFVAHIDLLCGGRAEVRDWVLDYLAFQVQETGSKALHMLVLKGMEGDGKSFIGRVMSAVMGNDNVRKVTSADINGTYNYYAAGSALCIMEDIVIGDDPIVQNTVKTLITEPTVTINEKYKAQMTVPNTTNYMAFTNDPAAIPASDTDRRYTIIDTGFYSLKSFEKALPCPREEYFELLHEVVDIYAGDMRRWFLNRDLSGYDPRGRALHTVDHDAMRQESADRSGVLSLDDLQEVINDGGYCISDEVVYLPYLADAIGQAGFGSFTDKALGPLVRKLGYTIQRRDTFGIIGSDIAKRKVVWVHQSVDLSSMSEKESREYVRELVAATDILG